MVGYKILEVDNFPDSLRNKPRWVSCVVFTMGLLIITMSAISIGIFFGYTYCYLENRNAIRTGNLSHVTDLQILSVPTFNDNEDARFNRTINGAISNVLVSRILKIGHALIADDSECVQNHNDDTGDISLLF